MSVRITRNKDRTKKVVKEMRKLGGKTIKVGIFGEDSAELVKIARANEFGVTIRPRSSKYLAIPAKKARGSSPGDHPDLVFISANKGNGGVLAKKTPKGQPLDIYFYLVKSVTIPERSFIRAGIDKNMRNIEKKYEKLIEKVLQREIKANVFLDMLGLELAGYIQKEARRLSSPGNAPVTTANKGSSNPLVDKGQLIGNIRHKVE